MLLSHALNELQKRRLKQQMANEMLSFEKRYEWMY